MAQDTNASDDDDDDLEELEEFPRGRSREPFYTQKVIECLRKRHSLVLSLLEPKSLTSRFALLEGLERLAEASPHRREAIEAFCICGSQLRISRGCFLLKLLDDPDEGVRRTAIEHIGYEPRMRKAADFEYADPAIFKLLEMLPVRNSDDESQIEICRALARIGRATAEVISRLLRLVTDPPNLATKSLAQVTEKDGSNAKRQIEEAAVAIATIDPEGDIVLTATWKLSELIHLRDLLRTIRASSTSNLTTKLDKFIRRLQSDCLEGYQRMRLSEVRSYIYGPNPHTDSPDAKDLEKKWNNARDGHIKIFLDQKRLHGIRIDEGIYDVKTDDLNILRTIYWGTKGADT